MGCSFRTAFFIFAEKTMKLIIDCGSTKADWLILDKGTEVANTSTNGFNPNYTDKDTISSITLNNNIYTPYIHDIREVYFYGSGCASIKNCNLIEDIFKNIFRSSKIVVNCDLMAASHALMGDKNGIVGILGTGSNSCFYENGKIKERAISLGYILGDEGSGSHIGKSLLRDYFYAAMPKDLRNRFEERYDLRRDNVIDNIYSNSQASRYIASFVPFAYDNINNSYIKNLCAKCFNEYIDIFLKRYDVSSNNIGIVGSIAYYFRDIINECFEYQGFNKPQILKSPIEGLKIYHSVY